MEKEIIQGTRAGSCTRGRPKTTMFDSIKQWTLLSLTELVRNVKDKHQRRKIVDGADNPRSENS